MLLQETANRDRFHCGEQIIADCLDRAWGYRFQRPLRGGRNERWALFFDLVRELQIFLRNPIDFFFESCDFAAFVGAFGFGLFDLHINRGNNAFEVVYLFRVILNLLVKPVDFLVVLYFEVGPGELLFEFMQLLVLFLESLKVTVWLRITVEHPLIARNDLTH